MQNNVQGKVVGLGGNLPSHVRLEPSFHDHCNCRGWTPAALGSGNSFLNRFWNRANTDWNNHWKYKWWEFFPQGGTVDPFGPRRFDTTVELANYLADNLPMLAGNYDDGVNVRCYDAVDYADSFPRIRIVRNSIIGSVRGRRRWLVGFSSETCGISSGFNAPNYYAGGFPGNTGRLFVQKYTGFLPGTNNDDVVWATRKKRTMWSFPKVGNLIQDLPPGARRAAWNTNTLNWVTPAPQLSYAFQNPFLWYENYWGGVLAVGYPSDLGQSYREAVLNGPAALVFPVVSGDHVAFAVYPMGFDTFYTDRLGTDEELITKATFKRQSTPRYKVLTSSSVDRDVEMFHTGDGGGNHFMQSTDWPNSSNDGIRVPHKVYVAKRNTVTGVRSKWVKLGIFHHRVPHSSHRFDPAYKWTG